MSCLVSMDKLIIRPVYKAQFMKKKQGGGGAVRLYYHKGVFAVYLNIIKADEKT